MAGTAEVIETGKPSNANVQKEDLAGFLERTAKYTARWAKRFVQFHFDSRKLGYGETQANIKATIVVTKIARVAEFDPQLAMVKSADLYTLVCDGTTDDGKTESWKFRFPDESTFTHWYAVMRHCLAGAGQMVSQHFGLPAEDPRNGLAFQDIPTEYLLKFQLLEKAIVYFFGRVNIHLPAGIGPTGGKTTNPVGDLFMMIGDKCIYIFRPSADVVRCFDPTLIESVYLLDNYVALKCIAPEHDILIKNTFGRTLELLEVLKKIVHALAGGRQLIEEPAKGSVDDLADSLHLHAYEGAKMNVISPTPKVKLRQALDKYLKANGSTFTQSTAMKGPQKSTSEFTASKSRELTTTFEKTVDPNDPMVLMLIKIGLRQYVNVLVKQHIDQDMLTCMEPDDLLNFGITNPDHREKILKAANGDEVEAASPTGAGGAGDDDLEVAVPGAGGDGAGGAPVVNLDDDDDLDVAVPGAGGGAPVVNLDSDDDLEVSPAPARPEISLDSDDGSDDDLQVFVQPSGAEIEGDDI